MPRESVAASARNIFDGLSAFLPKRLCEEELGDALEDINERIRRGRPKWELVAKIASTIFWVLTHALLDFALKVLSLINGTGKKA